MSVGAPGNGIERRYSRRRRRSEIWRWHDRASWLCTRRSPALWRPSRGRWRDMLASVLELHCVNFEALHVLVWHTAVVPVSAAAGALVGWVLRSRRKLA